MTDTIQAPERVWVAEDEIGNPWWSTAPDDEMDAYIHEDKVNAMVAAALREAAHLMPRYFGVWSPTGVHVGVWHDGATAAKVLGEYPGGVMRDLIDMDAILALIPDAGGALNRAIADRIAALEAERDALAEKLAKAERALSLTRRADDLREVYHRLPNDKSRIGDKRSKKSHARDAWLRTFRKAAREARATLAQIGDKTDG